MTTNLRPLGNHIVVEPMEQEEVTALGIVIPQTAKEKPMQGTVTAAGPGKVLMYGIVPQVMPAFFAVTILRWDINIRESTVVGLVGAGGIGLPLDASIASLQWSQATVIFVMILVLVVISEWVSAKVRGAIR